MSNIKRITKELFGISSSNTTEFVVKMTVNLYRNGPKILNASGQMAPIISDHEFAYDFYLDTDNVSGLYIKTSQSVIIESKHNRSGKPGIPQAQNQSAYVKVRLYNLDLDNVTIGCDAMMELISAQESFTYTRDNMPSDISEDLKANPKTKIVYLRSRNFISFEPCVLMSGVESYKGVLIRCTEGVIGRVTIDEFRAFIRTMKEIANNFLSISNSMLNTAYLSSLSKRIT